LLSSNLVADKCSDDPPKQQIAVRNPGCRYKRDGRVNKR
jgi:hypothetical protein